MFWTIILYVEQRRFGLFLEVLGHHSTYSVGCRSSQNLLTVEMLGAPHLECRPEKIPTLQLPESLGALSILCTQPQEDVVTAYETILSNTLAHTLWIHLEPLGKIGQDMRAIDHVNTSILHSGFKTQHKGDSRNLFMVCRIRAFVPYYTVPYYTRL